MVIGQDVESCWLLTQNCTFIGHESTHTFHFVISSWCNAAFFIICFRPTGRGSIHCLYEPYAVKLARVLISIKNWRHRVIFAFHFFTHSTVQFIRDCSHYTHNLIENGIIPSLCEKLSRFIGKYQSVHRMDHRHGQRQCFITALCFGADHGNAAFGSCRNLFFNVRCGNAHFHGARTAERIAESAESREPKATWYSTVISR